MYCCCDLNFDVPKKHKNSLIPISSGEQRCAPEHSWGAGVRLHYTVHYVISGKGVFYCGTNKFRLRKGQIFVIFPGAVTKYQADELDPWHYAWVNFQGDEAKEILSAAGLSVTKPVMDMADGEAILSILRQMPPERSTDAGVNLSFTARLYEFMSVVVGNENNGIRTGNGYLEVALSYIKAHYYGKITVEQIASHVGISRKYLFAVFKNTIGISPKDYIIEYRIKRAKELLADKSLSVGHIAYSVGYEDQLTFSKMIKQQTGMSPTEYRQTIV